MKRLLAYTVGISCAACAVFGMGDAVSTTETGETESGYMETVTTYERDGRKILVDYEVSGKGRHYWNRIIHLGELRIARIVTIDGETSYMTDPDVPVEVVFRYSEDGDLLTVGLAHEEIGAVEGFTVENGRLTPMKGDDIVRYQESSADIDDLFKARGSR